MAISTRQALRSRQIEFLINFNVTHLGGWADKGGSKGKGCLKKKGQELN